MTKTKQALREILVEHKAFTPNCLEALDKYIRELLNNPCNK